MTDQWGWLGFVIGVIAYQVLKMLWLIVRDMIQHRRQKKFIRMVRFIAKDDSTIAYYAIDASDRKALRALEEELREDFDIPVGGFINNVKEVVRGKDRNRDRD